nr:uncharacterized protein LOC123756462 [Procambarus clarkii]
MHDRAPRDDRQAWGRGSNLEGREVLEHIASSHTSQPTRCTRGPKTYPYTHAAQRVMKGVGVVIMICVETVALSGSTVSISDNKNTVAPSARYGGVTHILMRHREEHQVSESTVSDDKFSGVKLAMNRHNGSDHNITEESQLIASNLNTGSQNTSTESVRLTVNDKISAEHRDSPGNYSKTNGKVAWGVTKVSTMTAEPFSKETQSTLADNDPNHKRASGENPPFPAPLSVPGFTFPWTIMNVTTNLVSGDSYESNRHKSEEVASERSHVPPESLPGPPHSTARQWRETAITWTSEPEEEEWMEKKVITKGYVTALSRPPYTLDHTYLDSSQAGFFWSWEAILLVSLPGAWLVLLAVMCCLTRSRMGRKLLQWLGPPPPNDDDDLEQGHGILFFDGSPGMRRSLTDPEGAAAEEVEEQAERDEERDVEKAGGVKTKYTRVEVTAKQANGLTPRIESSDNGGSHDKQLSEISPLSPLKTLAFLENLTMQRKLSLISEESSH